MEKAGLPYSGSNAWGYRLGTDKAMMKKEMEKNNIPTPKYMVVNNGSGIMNNGLMYPVIIKPSSEHCGIGIGQESLVNSDAELGEKVEKMLGKYKQPVLAEEFIDGRELHVTILDKRGQPWVLPPAEVVFVKKAGFRPILSYEGKWDEKSEEYKLSNMELAKLDPDIGSLVEDIAKECYRKLGGKDYPRVDMRVRGDEVFALEINNNPGIDYDAQSGIGVSARAVGLSWEGLLKYI